MKQKTIWALQDGDYSDYHVIGVFSSRDNAKIVQEKVGGEIVEWPLNPGVEEINGDLKHWNVLMLRDGSTERCEENKPSQYDIAGRSDLWRRSQAPAYKGQGIQDALHCLVWAKDKKHAIKIVNEKRIQMIAGNKWNSIFDTGHEQ